MNDVALRLEAVKYANNQGYTVPKLLKAEPFARSVRKTFSPTDDRRSDARFIAELESIKKGEKYYDAAFVPIEKDSNYTVMVYVKGGPTV